MHFLYFPYFHTKGSFFYFLRWGENESTGTSDIIGLLYQPWIIDDDNDDDDEYKIISGVNGRKS